jgi:hypothetical protein
MAFIKLHELRPAGSELFQDSESYLNELNEQEIANTFGGGGSDLNISAISQVSLSVGISIDTATVVSQVKSDVYASFGYGKKKYY